MRLRLRLDTRVWFHHQSPLHLLLQARVVVAADAGIVPAARLGRHGVHALAASFTLEASPARNAVATPGACACLCPPVAPTGCLWK